MPRSSRTPAKSPASSSGPAPDHIIAAGALHDTLEKTPTRPDDLHTRFGARITRLVLALTEDPRISDHDQRKAALRAQAVRGGRDAVTIFAADKISGSRTLARNTATRTREQRQLARQKLEHYRHCLVLLEQRIPDQSLVQQLRAHEGAVRLHDAACSEARLHHADSPGCGSSEGTLGSG
jgi:hypothetical protein